MGHTTATSCRLWIRADDPDDHGADLASYRRTLGVLAVVKEGNTVLDEADAYVQYFRLHREFDRTGAIELGRERGITDDCHPPKLKPNTEYRVRIGTLTLDDPHADDETLKSEDLAGRLPPARVWFADLLNLKPTKTEAVFRTFPRTSTPSSTKLSFIVGSCRYPGLLWKARRADAIFGPLRREANGDNGRDKVSFVMMVGDQIYADLLNRAPIGRADTFEEFQSRYVNAFSSPHMRELLRHFPHYMILDDHDIEDNWAQDRIGQAASRRVFNFAIGAYMSYQWSHGPRNYGRRLFYDLNCGGYPFFVLDTRTQRFLDDVAGLDDNHLLGRPTLAGEEPSQLDLLCQWLTDRKDSNVPKFIVSSSVFAPNPMSAREGQKGSSEQVVKWKEASDSWPAFPSTRKRLLRTIINGAIQNVVFVSGDIHCSNVAKIRLSGSPAAQKLKAYSITSSALYWPFPFADGEPSSYVHDSTRRDEKDTFRVDGRHKMDYQAWNFTQEDNYCRVDIDRTKHCMTVRPFDAEGNPIRKGTWFGTGGEVLEGTLDLAPW